MTKQERSSVSSVREIIEQEIVLKGLAVVDVGCGSGGLVRWMAAKGARVTGVECQSRLVSDAGSKAPVSDEIYLEGVGQALPVANASADLIVFSYSLHHVPAQYMLDALREARRVLNPGGTVLTIEPVADGDYFEVMRLIDDETEVRRLAYEALKDTQSHGLKLEAEHGYFTSHLFADDDDMVRALIEVDPARREPIDRYRSELKKRFYRYGTKTTDGYCFKMEIRSNQLSRANI